MSADDSSFHTSMASKRTGNTETIKGDGLHLDVQIYGHSVGHILGALCYQIWGEQAARQELY